MQNTRDAGEWEGDWGNQGPQAYCDDEGRKKIGLQSEDRGKEGEEVYGVCQRMVESAAKQL